ncbi:hypothetical protein ABEB36_000834 [Hypothenemus hampei]|uniref:N-acetylgalactosamine kinase n=1 Tax=Hypothenemus hampei TaxID=57062 RepID=A0ABD1FEG5_HYPHA
MMAVEIHQLSNTERTTKITEKFLEYSKQKPEFYVRVPGRVNLIGEHIDYCGYGVCPMALEQDIFLAVGTRNDKKLILHNTDEKFESFYDTLDDIEINLNDSTPKWFQYFLCGLKGVLETVTEDKKHQLKGLEVVVDGTVPQSAGLSSSSALVSAAALAASHCFNLSLTKDELADLCAKCEQYIGTQGGGMDQAIAFLANEGSAKLIEFEPLRSTEVKLPQGAVFVIAHSLTNLNKAATADYNCRVVECRLGAQVIAKKQGLDWTKIKRLGDVQKALNLNLDDMIVLTTNCLRETPYSKEDVIKELNTTSSLLDMVSLTPNTRNLNSFKLLQRALHVFNEAKRVQEFHKTCQEDFSGESALITLGKLMSESHDSLKNLYECSHQQLDRIVDLAKRYTLGTRLTGAGWGGCTISLLTADNVENFKQFLIDNYYKPLGVTDNYESVIFNTTPKRGACIYLPNF